MKRYLLFPRSIKYVYGTGRIIYECETGNDVKQNFNYDWHLSFHENFETHYFQQEFLSHSKIFNKCYINERYIKIKLPYFGIEKGI